jgi:hypothetical protein
MLLAVAALVPDTAAQVTIPIVQARAETGSHIRLDGVLPVVKSLAFVLADGRIGEGDLFVTVHVDENGVPQSAKVYATPSSRISKKAATVLMTTKYQPAVCTGKPCSAEFPFTAHLSVD